MAEYLIQDTTLDAIADAINAKTGGSSAMTPAEMVTEIGSIQTGGSSFAKIGTYTIAENVRMFTIDISQNRYKQYAIKINATCTGADYLQVVASTDSSERFLGLQGNAFEVVVYMNIVEPDPSLSNQYSVYGGAVDSNLSYLKLYNRRPSVIAFFAYRANGVINAGSTFELYAR